MSVNIMCLTSGGGIPLFSRHKGKADSVPFSTVASLNGVHMYGKARGVVFMNTKTEASTIVWREFEDSVVLIAISILNDEAILSYLLEAVFSAMVLSVGLELLKSLKNIERLKRELRACYPLVDRLMDTLDFNEKNLVIDFISYNETTMFEGSKPLKTYLNNYAECCSTQFGCITVDSCIVVATDTWLELSRIEQKLLLYLISTNNSCSYFDLAVYLPQRNPMVPARAVGVRLIGNVCVTVLCGTQPDLVSAEQIAFQCWTPAMELLQSIRAEIPQNLDLHSTILGFLLLDFSLGRYISSMFSPMNRRYSRSSSDVLRTFYYQSGHLLANSESECIESYWCSEYHKVHAMRRNTNILCILYTSAIPTHTMRTVTVETMDLLTSEPRFSW